MNQQHFMPIVKPPSLSLVNAIDDNTVLEAESQRSDDATCESLDLASLTSSIVDYEFENGRRYHAFKAGHYPLPNDESELERLDLQHHVITLLLNGEYHLAPLKNPKNILDIGTGTGLWAIEMGDKFPSATVTGVDLSPVQPTWVPDNVLFEIDDIESEWLWSENLFDHIHSRIMIGAISSWKDMIQRSFKHCKPGGYLEIQELDPRLQSDDGTAARSIYHLELLKLIFEASEKYGKIIPYHNDFKGWLEEAGFVDVRSYTYKIPINSWPKDPRLKEVGKYQCLNYYEGYEAISIGLLTRALGWTYLEFSVFMAKVRKELTNKSIHAYQSFVVCIGRKPFPHEIQVSQQALAHHHTTIEPDTEGIAEPERPYTAVTDEAIPVEQAGHQQDISTDAEQMSVDHALEQHALDQYALMDLAPETASFGTFYHPLPLAVELENSHQAVIEPILIRGNQDYADTHHYSGADLEAIDPTRDGYAITLATGRPNDFPQRPKPRPKGDL